jgi:hypothetical protein
MNFFNNLFRKKDINTMLADLQDVPEGGHGISLVKNLTLRDLTALGIAAVIGAGIFSTIGNACCLSLLPWPVPSRLCATPSLLLFCPWPAAPIPTPTPLSGS